MTIKRFCSCCITHKSNTLHDIFFCNQPRPFNGEWYLDNFPYGMFNVVLELRPGPNTLAPQPMRLELKSGCDATSVHDQAWIQASWQHKCAAVGWSTTLQDAARPRLYASGAAADDFIALTMRNPEFQLRPTVPRAMHGARAYNTAYRGTFLLVCHVTCFKNPL